MANKHMDSITLVAGAALEPYRRVNYGATPGEVVYATGLNGKKWIGVTLPGPDGDAIASGGPVTVALRSSGRTMKVACSEAVAANDELYATNDGKVAAAGTKKIGIAADTATGAADGSVIEMNPYGFDGTN